MIKNLDQALIYILASEGSKPNISPGEPGGASKYGVSVTALSDQRRAHKLPMVTVEDVIALTEQQAKDFYVERFASVIRFNDLPSGVDYRTLDVEINLGPTGGIKALEAALNLPITGKMTDNIIIAANSTDARKLILAIGDTWIEIKRKSPSWPKYGRGWSNRLNIANTQALKMVI